MKYLGVLSILGICYALYRLAYRGTRYPNSKVSWTLQNRWASLIRLKENL